MGWTIDLEVFSNVYLQVDRTGNCLFQAIKKSLLVCTATLQEATYFPSRYFRRQVVHYIVTHRLLMYVNKFMLWCLCMGLRRRGRILPGVGTLLCPSNNTFACCSGEISGVMRWFCLLCPACGPWRLQFSTCRWCRSTGFDTMSPWTAQTWSSHTMPATTLTLQVRKSKWLNNELNDGLFLHKKLNDELNDWHTEWPWSSGVTWFGANSMGRHPHLNDWTIN